MNLAQYKKKTYITGKKYVAEKPTGEIFIVKLFLWKETKNLVNSKLKDWSLFQISRWLFSI